MPRPLRDTEKLPPGEERVWPGGRGTLFALNGSTLRVRADEDGQSSVDTEITVGTDGGIKNFELGKGIVISLSGVGWVAPFRDTKGRVF